MSQLSPAVVRYLKQQQQLYGDAIYVKSVNGREIMTETNQSQTEDKSLHPLERYGDEIRKCMKCQLGKTRTNFVFGVGNPDADIVFVGEAPGKDEDLQGIPFVGRAGKLLDKILAAINIRRQDVYILNVLKCRPPGNRDPLADEVERCEPYLKRQLEIIKPRVIVCLGRISGRTLLRLDIPLGKMRGQIYNYSGIDTVVTYHPAALLRNPNFKKFAWEDFQMIRDKYLSGVKYGG